MVKKPLNRILVLCKRLPNPKSSAGELRFWHIINILKESCRELVLLAEESVNFKLFPSAKLLTKSSLKENARDADVAILEFWYMYPFIPTLKSLNVPVIIDSVDVEYLRFERAEKILKKRYKRLKARKALEQNAYKMADAVWAVTREDANLIKKNCPDVTLVPTIHEPASKFPEFKKRNGVVFVGSFRHKPNVDGLRWYLKWVHPHVSDLPHTIIGHDAPKDIREAPGFIGGVSDSSQYVRGGCVSIAPLRYGAGMKGKIGEAFSNGTPVVTTTIGAEGYRIRNRVHFLLGNSPRSFAEGIRELYSNQKLWNKITRNARNVSVRQSPQVVKKTVQRSIIKTIQKCKV